MIRIDSYFIIFDMIIEIKKLNDKIVDKIKAA